jgi:hypothetical protein
MVQSDQGHPERAAALLMTALSAPGPFVFRVDAQRCLDRQFVRTK